MISDDVQGKSVVPAGNQPLPAATEPASNPAEENKTANLAKERLNVAERFDDLHFPTSVGRNSVVMPLNSRQEADMQKLDANSQSDQLKQLPKLKQVSIKANKEATEKFKAVSQAANDRAVIKREHLKKGLRPLVEDSANALPQFRAFRKKESAQDKGLLSIPAGLFLDKSKLEKGQKKNKEVVAELAQAKGEYKQVKALQAQVGKVVPYRFEINDGKVVLQDNEGVTPTSQESLRGVSGNDHLVNTYVLELHDGQRAVIRSGRIDTQQKADEFILLLEDLSDRLGYGDEDAPGGVKPMRVVSQQLLSYEVKKESQMIDKQHRWMAYANKKLVGKAEVVHINTPSNRWYHVTRSAERLGIPSLVRFLRPSARFLQGERLSREQNLDSLGTYVRWMKEKLDENGELKKLFANEVSTQIQTALESLNNSIVVQTNLKEANDNLIEEIDTFETNPPAHLSKEQIKTEIKTRKEVLGRNRSRLETALKGDHAQLQTLEDVLKEKEMHNTEAFQNISLLRQMLGSQLHLPGQRLDRGKEGMVFQLLNERLGVSSALSCKSGLDRTGCWHAVTLGMLAVNAEKPKNPEKAKEAAKAQFDLVNDWELTTTLLNKWNRRMKGGEFEQLLLKPKLNENEEKKLKKLMGKAFQNKGLLEKMHYAARFRQEVATSLLSVGIPITTVSTGVMGLKWGAIFGKLGFKWKSSFQENLIPLNFLPSHVVKTNDKGEGEVVPLVQYGRNGRPSGITKYGASLLTKFQTYRGT